MKLNEIVRTTFLPPEGNLRKDISIRYQIERLGERFIPKLIFDDDAMFSLVERNAFGFISIEKAKSFESAKKAIEYCWENFDIFYKEKFPGLKI